MRYTGPKARRCRRLNLNLFGADKYDRILQKRPHGPGKDPKTNRQGKLSEYGRQLLEKQKACMVYGVHDKRLRAVYSEASRTIGQTDRMMKTILERRLDNAIFKAGFANTRLQARQFAAHGMFTVNGQRVTIASYQLKPGDKVKVREQVKASPAITTVLQAHERYTPPEWIKSDMAGLGFEVTMLPTEDKHFDQSVDMRKVVGFYSR